MLKVSAVTWGAYNETENKALPIHLEPKVEFEVKPFDFLISRANTAELVARAVVVPADAQSKLMLSDKIIRFRFTEHIAVNYVNLVNNSLLSRHYYAQVAGGTSSSMKNVSRIQIQHLLIPLPPQSEQLRILAKVNDVQVICQELLKKLEQFQNKQVEIASALAEQGMI
ncbi:MAG TPA: hypothetical protein DF774_11400 [Rheinheimera sp.]|nr:hypothetical protein [Rheinheimera sp.]